MTDTNQQNPNWALSIPAIARWFESFEHRGIGPKRAEILATFFAGDNFNRLLTDKPTDNATYANARFNGTDGIKATDLLGFLNPVQRRLAQETKTEMARIALFAMGITIIRAENIIRELGTNQEVIEEISQNPWMMIGKVHGIGFLTADAIATKAGLDPNHPERARAAVKYQMGEASNEGHTWSYESIIAKKTIELCSKDGKPPISSQVVIDQIAHMVDERIICHSGGRLALKQDYFAEKEIFEWLVKSNKESGKHLTQAQAEAALSVTEGAEKLNELQRTAVINALINRACYITGGAGTGKTFSLLMIIRAYLAATKNEIRIGIAAPTGKAARRINEVVWTKESGLPVAPESGRGPGVETAKTIHRLLGYDPITSSPDQPRFLHNENNKLPLGLLIIDESSMIDVRLFRSLISAIDHTKTTVVIVGDPNQLPAVGPGALLRDIISNQLCPGVQLSQVVRQAGFLKQASVAILTGKVIESPDHKREWWIVRKTTHDEVLQFISSTYDQLIKHPNYGGENLLRSVQVLAPKRIGPLGIDVINRMLQAKLNPGFGGYGTNNPIRIGDKIIITKNNYTVNVMNGEQGVIIGEAKMENEQGRRIDHWRIDFYDYVTHVPKSSGIELAYAITVHKAQGSEFPVSIVLSHSTDSFMLTRSWLYTGVTRAKYSAVIIGDDKGIKRAAWNTRPNDRRTFLDQTGKNLTAMANSQPLY